MPNPNPQVLLALWVPKLRGPSGDMLVHHLATLTLATLGAGYGYLEHLAPFFFGLTELSSVRRPARALCEARAQAPRAELYGPPPNMAGAAGLHGPLQVLPGTQGELPSP